MDVRVVRSLIDVGIRELYELQGRSAEYIEKAMLQFKAGERPATVMNRIAKGYTDEEIKLLSAYLGKFAPSK